MRNRQSESAAATWLATLLFPTVMLLLVANALIFDPQTYRALLAPEAVPVTMQVLGYFRGKAPVPEVFDASEKSHLADVKAVINALSWLALALFAVFLGALWFARPELVFVRGFLLTLGIALLLAIVPFDAFFDFFHLVVFPQGNWMFPSGSRLIQFYPFDFFKAFFQVIVLYSLVFGAVLGVFGHISGRKHP